MKLKSEKGFNLIEILIVFAIIAILGAFSMPTFSKFRENRQLKEVAGEIAGDIQYYKQKAISENVRYLLYYPSGWNRLYLYKRICSNPCSVNFCLTYLGFKPLGSYASVVMSVSPFFDNSSTACYSSSYIHLTSRGTTGTGSITLRHTKRNSTAIIAITTMGRVRITYDLQ